MKLRNFPLYYDTFKMHINAAESWIRSSSTKGLNYSFLYKKIKAHQIGGLIYYAIIWIRLITCFQDSTIVFI